MTAPRKEAHPGRALLHAIGASDGWVGGWGMRRALVLGGLSTGYHRFWINGPAIRDAIAGSDLEVLLSEDLELLGTEALGRYDLLVNYTTDRDLTQGQWAGLQAFVRSGGGLLGIHNASDTFENMPAYLRMLGGHFLGHPPQMDIAVEFVEAGHPVTQGLDAFTVHDELYLLEWWPEELRLLAQTRSHGGGVTPVAWVRQEGAGRIFYLSLGHNQSTLEHPAVRELLRRAARWAMRA